MSHSGKGPATAATPTTKKSADNKTPRERFLTVGAARVGKAIKAIRNVKNVSVRKSYEYTAADWQKARDVLFNELNAVDAAFQSALAGKTSGPDKTNFTF